MHILNPKPTQSTDYKNRLQFWQLVREVVDLSQYHTVLQLREGKRMEILILLYVTVSISMIIVAFLIVYNFLIYSFEIRIRLSLRDWNVDLIV